MSYAQPSDLFTYGLNPIVVAGTPFASPSLQLTYLQASSDWADSKMRGRYGNGPSPLVVGSQAGGLGVYDPSLVMHVCYHAAYNIIVARGYAPADGSDTTYETRYKQAVEFFDGVQRQRTHLDVVTAALPPPQGNLPTVNTAPLRGW